MKTIATALLLVTPLLVTTSAFAVPQYKIVSLGFDDLEHTDNNGWKFSSASELNDSGQVSGYSFRYNGTSADLGRSAWIYHGGTTINIGLTGIEHTHGSSFKFSEPHLLNQSGKVSGHSLRYNGDVFDLGQSAWLYDGATTINIGLTDAEHTRNNGHKYSNADELNEAAQVSGTSRRYNGGSLDLGNSAWFYNGSTTINIGLTGVEHTRSNDFKSSVVFELNEAGHVSGGSARYNGGTMGLGGTAWIYNGTLTKDIGLTGLEHTSSSGFKFSVGSRLNEAGQVIGYAQRYDGGSTNLGRSAWLYDGSMTIDIGLTGPLHTRNDGFKESNALQLNETGQVIGLSGRFNGGNTSLGRSAWLYDGTTTTELGFTDAEHTRDDGSKDSVAFELNEAGQSSGVSVRYNGGSDTLGSSAWLYDGTTTVEIGLTGPEHTQSSGFNSSGVGQLNNAGQVIGGSARYNGGYTNLGNTAWLFDGTSTTDIGLTGPEHTRNDGYKESGALQLNQAGQVRGYSNRYDSISGTQLGQDAWFYDPDLDQTFPLRLSQRSDGSASSIVSYLGEDGLVLGSYTLYDASDNDLGPRAFYFTVADGLHDLGALVDGGLTASGWDYLANTIRANALGQIIGAGKLSTQDFAQVAYLLTLVPEPSALSLTLLTVVVFPCLYARRHSRATNRP